MTDDGAQPKLVEAVAAYDPRAFMAFGQKSVPRRLLERYLPKRFFDHPKSGFKFPANLFVKRFGGAAGGLPHLGNSPGGGLDAGLVGEVWKNLPAGGGWEQLATRLIVLDAFLGRHAQGRPGKDETRS